MCVVFFSVLSTPLVKFQGIRVSRKVVPTLTTFFFFFFFVFVFFVDEGLEDLNTTISGPSSARKQNTIYMAFR